MSKRFSGAVTFDLDTVLRIAWTKGLTLSQFDEGCAVCGDSKIEIHHIRSVKDVRGKYTAPDGRTFAQFKGAFPPLWESLLRKLPSHEVAGLC